MNYKEFSKEFWTEIELLLNSLKAQNKPLIAAFDADGTLWDTDLSETLFNYQIENNLVDLPADPFEYYENYKKLNNDPRPAYMWLAQINKNKKLSEVKNWASLAFKGIQPNPVFLEQKKLIELFIKNNVQVYIVTASVKWAVEPGAREIGLTDDSVIGVETEVINDLVTDQPIYPITYRQGKAEALLKKTNGIKPFFCSGNSIGDFELLQTATHFQLAVSAAARDDKLFRSEYELYQKAVELKWKTHRFI